MPYDGRAAVDGDTDALCEASEELLVMHSRFGEEYRRLLVAGIREPRQATLGVVTRHPPAGPERSSW